MTTKQPAVLSWFSTDCSINTGREFLVSLRDNCQQRARRSRNAFWALAVIGSIALFFEETRALGALLWIAAGFSATEARRADDMEVLIAASWCIALVASTPAPDGSLAHVHAPRSRQ